MQAEIGWLIERHINIQTQWLWKHDGMEFQWTTHSPRAMRFSRREDAEKMVEIFGDMDVRLTEHIWSE